MARSKNQIARRLYDEDYEDLLAGQKAAVTRAFNAQPAPAARASPRRAARTGSIKATVGRVDENGTQTCFVSAGTTIEQFLEQAGYELDQDKEEVVAISTGTPVPLSDTVVANENYSISPKVKSA